MDSLQKIKDILADILDIETEGINTETYLVRDLAVESIDFLEISVAINNEFNIKVIDDEIFLKKLRYHLNDVNGDDKNRIEYLIPKYPFLSKDRVTEIINDLKGGPTLKIKDLLSYINWKK